MHIGIIDDHFIFVEGLKLLLEDSKQFNHVSIYPCPASTSNQYRLPLNLFDILVLDITLPYISGLEICRKIKNETPAQKIILLSSRKDFDIKDKAIEAGADLLVNKEVEVDQLLEQIIQVKQDEHLKITENPTNQHITFQNGKSARITNREKMFLKLLTFEYNSREIAERMFVSEHTVIGYRKNLSKKLEVKNMIGLAKYALELFPESFYKI